LHHCLIAITEFLKKNNRYPKANELEDALELAKARMSGWYGEDQSNHMEGIDLDIFWTGVRYAECSVSPMAAFFGGIVAQEIVKYTGKYSPLK
jgi:ubiquitin-activating enzyme E1